MASKWPTGNLRHHHDIFLGDHFWSITLLTMSSLGRNPATVSPTVCKAFVPIPFNQEDLQWQFTLTAKEICSLIKSGVFSPGGSWRLWREVFWEVNNSTAGPKLSQNVLQTIRTLAVPLKSLMHKVEWMLRVIGFKHASDLFKQVHWDNCGVCLLSPPKYRRLHARFSEGSRVMYYVSQCTLVLDSTEIYWMHIAGFV